MKDKSVVSLRDVKRANHMFEWFYKNCMSHNNGQHSVIVSMTLGLAQCYYYRLGDIHRSEYAFEMNQMLERQYTKYDFCKNSQKRTKKICQKIEDSTWSGIEQSYLKKIYLYCLLDWLQRHQPLWLADQDHPRHLQ